MKQMHRALLALFAALLAAFISPAAWAHKASDAYLRLSQGTANSPIQAQLEVALRDLDRVFDALDANNDRALSFGEVKAALPEVEAWATSGVILRCGAAELRLPFRFEALEQRSDGVFIRLAATSSQSCDTQAGASLRYTLMQGIDADHRAVMSYKLFSASDSVRANEPKANDAGSAALAPSESWQAIGSSQGVHSPSAHSSIFATLGSFIKLGIAHISSGADHVAFVICLVLGLALTRRSEWKALLITVTAFTLGHSITLISATLGWVGSPVWVEPVIALSIAVAAARNLIHVRIGSALSGATNASPPLRAVLLSASLPAAFGLVHGLGFSGAMTEAQVPPGALVWALAGFNIGVELGQLFIIAAWGLIYWAIHRWEGYQRWVVQGGSAVLILLGLYWFYERTM
jgi:hypothetical protein